MTVEFEFDISGNENKGAQEPDGTFIVYSKSGENIVNQSMKIVNSDWTNAPVFQSVPSIITDIVSIWNIKDGNLGIGATGVWQNTKTIVKVPLNYQAGQEPPQNPIIGQTDMTIIYSIQNPNIISYEWFRFEFLQNGLIRDFMTSQLEGEFKKPFDMEGEYTVIVIGYKNEIQQFSRPTEPIMVNITRRSDYKPMPTIEQLLELIYGKENLLVAGNNIILDRETLENKTIISATGGGEPTPVPVTPTVLSSNWGEHTGGTTLTLTVSAIVGKDVIAVVTTRSDTSFSSDWKLIVSELGFSTTNQNLYILKKTAVLATESITVTQASSARIYIQLLSFEQTLVLSSFWNQSILTDTLTANTAIPVPNKQASDALLWAFSANMWQSSSTNHWFTLPNDIVIYKPLERQAVFFDSGNGAVSRTFSQNAATTGWGGLAVKIIAYE